MEKGWTRMWLSYNPVKDYTDKKFLKSVLFEGFSKDNEIVSNAVSELKLGISRMLGVEINETATGGLHIVRKSEIPAEGYEISNDDEGFKLSASDENGLLYGVFHILRNIAMNKRLTGEKISCKPDNPLRMLNHWDNMDGSIERGYSGESFFFKDGEIILDERTRDYAKMVASIGINGIVINNVNVKNEASFFITERYFEKLKAMSEIFAGYGIKLFLSLNFASPIEVGGLDSADPLNEEVINWWKKKLEEVFDRIPGLGGFLVKADSEGRPGPFTYGRTQADGANMIADIVKEYKAIIIWRCFVYNCAQDWRDRRTDRAKAGYDNFMPMDGDYHDNVILQIKNGPMDFQIREPVSPLIGGLKKTNRMLEVQIAQEYTGHQIDLCYLIPMFKEILSFRTYCNGERGDNDTVADIISGRTFGNGKRGMAGITAVCNTGNDLNWTGNDLAAANLYGFGRLAYSMELTAEEIACEWTAQTFALEEENRRKIEEMLLKSRDVYEKYTCPLGIGWMVNPGGHYGPSVDGYEYSRWGTYHRADHLGIGVDRTENGTGYVKQYNEPNASMFADKNTCPEELLLFFHHVEYKYLLKTGKTLIQHIYDTHFEGYDEAVKMSEIWKSLKGKLPEDVYERVNERFDRQLENAREWRDQVNSYFYRKSGIRDEKNRTIY